MKFVKDHSASEWFRAAADCYLERHQGCPDCGRLHCVFRSFWGKRIEFFCSVCEFSVCFDAQTGNFQVTPGQTTSVEVPAFVLDVNG
jgi:hypothetical protein